MYFFFQFLFNTYWGWFCFCVRALNAKPSSFNKKIQKKTQKNKSLQKIPKKKISQIFPKKFSRFWKYEFPTSHLEAENPFGLVGCSYRSMFFKKWLFNTGVKSLPLDKGTSINEVPRFLAIFDLPCPTL